LHSLEAKRKEIAAHFASRAIQSASSIGIGAGRAALHGLREHVMEILVQLWNVQINTSLLKQVQIVKELKVYHSSLDSFNLSFIHHCIYYLFGGASYHMTKCTSVYTTPTI